MKYSKEPVNISEIVKSMAAEAPERGITVGEMIERLGEEGMLVAVIVLTFPFLLPVSIPGTSTPFGTLIIIICISLMTRGPLRLPRRLGSIRIRQKHMRAIADRAAAVLMRMERWSKPRLLPLTSTSALINAHMIAVIVNSICMMLPLPLPFSNTIPAYGIVFSVLGLLRRDGALIVGGYVMLGVILSYFAAVYVLGAFGVKYIY
ncbi:exopolysaccharide biosynthesis protein [Paenibacillus thermotolerans]|uniref:exopolysaccharide biosynthesis protein n=1 Tax=Paenibacillus thermotolerans TaxID=3027807 RepID=UPI002368182D|nr:MULTISPECIES: exopolysaccharide biosynthesis protein [unclassified Paenibacillus]